MWDSLTTTSAVPLVKWYWAGRMPTPRVLYLFLSIYLDPVLEFDPGDERSLLSADSFTKSSLTFLILRFETGYVLSWSRSSTRLLFETVTLHSLKINPSDVTPILADINSCQHLHFINELTSERAATFNGGLHFILSLERLLNIRQLLKRSPALLSDGYLSTYGEGWHNNHHAHPNVASSGQRWWEIDVTMWAIQALNTFGLAKKVVSK